VQYHHRGFVTGDPRISPASGFGLREPELLREEVDVMIVGAGPAGHIAAAQLAQFPRVTTRFIDRAAGPLEIGRADGVQSRTVETFQAFGFANRIIEEAYRITAMAFWAPAPDDKRRIVRTGLVADDPGGISEFPHLVVNQARVHDYFAQAMMQAPARIRPEYGIELLNLAIANTEMTHPVSLRVRHLTGSRPGEERIIRAKYLIGTDGARSRVRECIGCEFVGRQAKHAWGVLDLLAVTDFPDIRLKCAIRSTHDGSLLLIPREGGHLVRMYVDLGEVEDDGGSVRDTPLSEIIARANRILHPYTVEAKSVAWQSVYEVGHRLTDRFDDVGTEIVDLRTPRVFIAGDACHTHSAKAGQGMNVSMQDGFNIAWKLGHVLDGRAPEALLRTYSFERKAVAQALIEFDTQWSALLVAKPADAAPAAVEEFYRKTFDFTAGFMTRYAPSILTAEPLHQELAVGFPIGQRFSSAEVVRVCDANPVHLGHHARADGRWRIYVFADALTPEEPSVLNDFARWIEESEGSPILASTPRGADIDAWFDLKVIYQQRFDRVDLRRVPTAFLPRSGPLDLIDYEKVYAVGPAPDGSVKDIFAMRGISRAGVMVIVRPDQYVANVLPLSSTHELQQFFEPLLIRVRLAA
jgi:phenol 2-monooxygenase